MPANWLQHSSIPIADESNDDLNFTKEGEKLAQKLFLVNIPKPEGFQFPEKMDDHINLVKAYLLGQYSFLSFSYLTIDVNLCLFS